MKWRQKEEKKRRNIGAEKRDTRVRKPRKPVGPKGPKGMGQEECLMDMKQKGIKSRMNRIFRKNKMPSDRDM